ncbi:MAG: ABC transporter substrate-binding protein [Candidatus Fimenecus sp.]
MKNFKKVLAVVMALTLIVTCFAACGKKKTTYFIGATGPLTGDNKSYGNSVNNGAKLAIEEINNAGGLNGVLFEYEMLDDVSRVADAAKAYDALFDKGMQISLGSVTSGACEAFAKRAAEDNLFFITPSASQASIIENRSNAFRVCFGDPDQGILAAQELTSTYTKIGCIYDTSDTYSSGIFEAFDSEMKKLGKTYEVRTFDADNKTDFSSQVEALKNCEVIFLPIYYTEAGLIARVCVDKNLDIVLFGCDGLDGIAAQIDETVKNKISYITPFDVNSTDEKAANFVKNYEAKYGAKPDQFAADGYDAVYIIFEAMKVAGVNDVNISASDLCNLVVKAITSDSFTYKGVTGEMKWDASGACTKVPVIVEINK